MLMALETGPAHVCEHYSTDSTSVLNEVLGATVQHAVLFLFLIQMEAGNPVSRTLRMTTFVGLGRMTMGQETALLSLLGYGWSLAFIQPLIWGILNRFLMIVSKLSG
jgi:hypothetical protein